VLQEVRTLDAMNTGHAAGTWRSIRVGIGFNSAAIRERIAFWQRE
jgi:hypothetical protein